MKISKILIVGGILASLCACDDYLDESPKDLLGTDKFYTTAAQSEQGILGVYADLRMVTDYEYLELSELRSDNMWAQPQPNGQRDWSDIKHYRGTSALDTYENTWNTWYKVIYDANVALSKIPNVTYDNEAIKQQNLNEAHFLRGYAYFELVRLFGNVPVITEPVTPSAANGVGQTSGTEVINNVVIPDLEQALNLPDKGSIVNAQGVAVPQEGRADQTAAQAMLARVYTTLAGYPFNDASATAKAKQYLDLVLAKKNKYWAPNMDEWRKQWMPSTSYYNKYSIFAIQHRSGGSGNPALFNMLPSLPTSYTTIRIFGNEVWMDKTLRAMFGSLTESNDERALGYTILDGYDQEPNFPAYTNITDTVHLNGQVVESYTRSMMYKFFPSKHKLSSLGMTFDESQLVGSQSYLDWPVNFPVLRIEDMMLLRAEIYVNEGDIASAMDLVNQIRTRAGVEAVPASGIDKNTAMNYVERERRLELACEGVRWFDEIRLGNWYQTTLNQLHSYNDPAGTDASNIKQGKYLCPIPSNQMQIKPGTYTQNADWE